MSEQQGSIFNFLKMVEQGEVESSLPQPAPFGLKDDDSSHKITFLKARAKNFRSIGSDFMELDFTRNKSTLVVSDDNGAGKSTMCIWCPYYAMFGKPYSPKEKMAGLINSSTRKDCLVEFEFTTKGKYWMVRRGQKPTVFEILYRNSDDQEWVKEESEAALRDQQKYLESLLGFDAKIAENVIILGADKFVPFIEMDAPSRRHVVETIWDLAIFPTMLKVAKEDHAVNNVRSDNMSVEIDSTTSDINHTIEMLELVTAEIPRLDIIKQNASDYESTASNLSVEANTLREDLAEKTKEYEDTNERLHHELHMIETDVNSEYLPKIEGANNNLEKTKKSIDAETATITSEWSPTINAMQRHRERKSVERVSVLETLKTGFGEEYDVLNERLKTADQTADQEIEKIKNERLKTVPTPNTKLSAIVSQISDLRGEISELEIDLKETEELLCHNNKQLTYLNGQNTKWHYDLENIRDQESKLTEKLEQFQHLGTCPTCSQHIGQEAIELFAKKLEDETSTLTEQSSTVMAEITRIEIEIEELKLKCSELGGILTDTVGAKSTKEEQIETLRAEYDAIKKVDTEIASEFTRETDRMIVEKRSEIVHGINSEIASFKSSSMLELNNTKHKFEQELKIIDDEIKEIESERDSKITHKRHQIEIEVKQLEMNLSLINSEHQKVLAEKTSELVAQITELNMMFNEYSSTANQRIARLAHDSEQALRKRDELMKTYHEQYDNCITRQNELSGKRQALETRYIQQSEEFEKINKLLAAYKFLITELGDKAAKAEIIKAYLPYFNSKVNEYLEAMNLFVGFKIDENFDVEFTAPDRRGQSTFSLSKGQLTRLNLAVMFSLRDIANLKSSVASSLLVLDESLEALSERGVREVTEMMNQRFQHMNVFVVSQRATEFDEYFTSSIRYGLRGGFTEII